MSLISLTPGMIPTPAPSYGKGVFELTTNDQPACYGFLRIEGTARYFSVLAPEDVPSIFGRARNIIAHCFELISDLFTRYCFCSRNASEEALQSQDDPVSEVPAKETDDLKVDDGLDVAT